MISVLNFFLKPQCETSTACNRHGIAEIKTWAKHIYKSNKKIIFLLKHEVCSSESCCLKRDDYCTYQKAKEFSLVPVTENFL